MLLCVCHAVSDRTVRALVQREGCSSREIACRTGAGTGCGACVADLRRLVENERAMRADAMAAK